MPLSKILSSILIAVSCLTVAPEVASAHARPRPSPLAPIRALPFAVQRVFACIIWHESRSTLAHPNMGDNNADGGSSGVFQIIPTTWNWWAPKVGIHVPVWRATFAQQVRVAVEIERNDGFWPWSTYALCR